MDINLNNKLYLNYNSNSQKARVLTEPWIKDNFYCPRCGYHQLDRFPNNKKVADFFCPKCNSQYELKSKNGKFSKKVLGGAYDATIQRITGNENPDFLFLSYSKKDLKVNELFFVPKHFFVPAIIEKRKPLKPTAKRPGWVGCNILINEIPEQGKVSIISNGKVKPMTEILSEINKYSALAEKDINKRGWLMDVLCCINKILTQQFTMKEMYAFEKILSEKYPDNNNVRAKIRQQLQFLRNKGFIEFLGRGIYRKII